MPIPHSNMSMNRIRNILGGLPHALAAIEKQSIEQKMNCKRNAEINSVLAKSDPARYNISRRER